MWNWLWLYYLGTVVLGMSEAEFWRCTPRKLFALAEVHLKVHSGEGQKEKPQERLTLQELLSWR